jgi:hypothetical protein
MIAARIGTSGEIRCGDDRLARETAHICGANYYPGVTSSMCYSVSNELVAGVLYESVRPGASCFVHVATQKAQFVPRDMWWAAFYLPFIGWGCKKIIGPISETNAASLSLARRLGFVEEVRLAGVYPEACVFMTLHRENCWCLSRITPRRFEVPNGRLGSSTP